MSRDLLEPLVKIAVLLFGIMTAAAYFVLLERWMAAWVQMRRGPNRVGIPLTKIRLFGLGQPLADGLKFIFKEEYTPAHVNRRLFLLAPFAILTAALATYAVIPFGSALPVFDVTGVTIEAEGERGDQIRAVVDETLAQRRQGAPAPDAQVLAAHPELQPELGAALDQIRPIPLVVAPGVDVGMIFVFALSSVAVYGVILGGWASNNKYSFLGGLRSSAQMIAYELPLGLGVLGVVLASGSLRLETIIHGQAATGVWNAFSQPLGLLVFTVAAFAEAARLPFDLPEAEQELIGGYHTEYAGIKLLLFLVAEFVHMITASVLIVILFFGGWHLWGLTGSNEEAGFGLALVRVAVFCSKVFCVILFFMLARWSWPRFRFDQLMALGWKVMLPLGLSNFTAMAAIVEYRDTLGQPAAIALGWIVAIGSLAALASASPVVTDNRARLGESG